MYKCWSGLVDIVRQGLVLPRSIISLFLITIHFLRYITLPYHSLLLPAGIIYFIYFNSLHTFLYHYTSLHPYSKPPHPIPCISQYSYILHQIPPIPFLFTPISFLSLATCFPSSNKPNPTPIRDHIYCCKPS